MSVRDLNKIIIVSDALNGNIIDTIDRGLYEDGVSLTMIMKLIDNDLENEHGLVIKHGYKN